MSLSAVVLIGIGVLLAGYYALGRVFADFALKRGSNADSAVKASLKPDGEKTPAQLTEEEKLRQARAWSAQVRKTEHDIQSADGLRLHGFLYENQAAAGRFALLLHGFQDDHGFMEPYALEYYRAGYHVLIPDQRAHGLSEGAYTTMGWREQDDVRRWIDWILARDPKAGIVLHGVSMGAATIMLAAGGGLPDNVKACVSDCGYTALWDEYKGKIQEMFHLPAAPLLAAASLAARLRPGFPIRQVSPADALRKNRVPMLFIHGDADDYNPYEMMDELYRADASGEKQKLTVPGARHARSIYTDYETYWDTVRRFLDKYLSGDTAR